MTSRDVEGRRGTSREMRLLVKLTFLIVLIYLCAKTMLF